MNVKALLERKGELAKKIREFSDAAEGRDFTAEERQNWDQLNDDFDGIEAAIKREQETEEKLRRSEEEAEQRNRELRDSIGGNRGGRDTRDEETETVEERRERVTRDGFSVFCRSGMAAMNAEQLRHMQERAIQADVDVSGGYLLPPGDWVAQLIKAKDNLTFVRQYATVMPVTSGDSLGAPSLDTDVEDGTWTGEITSADEDTALAFGKRELHPHPLAKLVKVSRKLMRTSSIPPEQLIRDRLAYKFSVTEENKFLNGTGAGQPLGIFTASDNGISTDRDVDDDNNETSITADGLINAAFKLKSQYWTTARWIFHRDALKQIRKLKDGNSQYLWQPGLTGGLAGTILDMPYDMSEYAPNTFTTGQYVGALCDWSHYWVADSLAMQVQRLDELYAVTNQVGFIGRAETDGMPVLEEAFVRVTLA